MPERLPKTFTRWVYNCPQCGAQAWKTEDGEGRNRGNGPQRPPSPGATWGQTRHKQAECEECTRRAAVKTEEAPALATTKQLPKRPQAVLRLNNELFPRLRWLCAACGSDLRDSPHRVYLASFCSNACRQAFYRMRKRAETGLPISSEVLERFPIAADFLRER